MLKTIKYVFSKASIMGCYMLNKIKYFFSKIPIIGALVNISIPAQFEALVELIITVLFSTLPIWLGGAIFSIDFYFNEGKPNNEINFETYKGFFFSSIENGELLMYAAATLGPTLYLGLSSFGKRGKPFQWVRPQLILAILVNIFASVLFFNARANDYTTMPEFIEFTFILYAFSLILLFPAMAFEHEKKKADVVDAQQEDQNDYINGYRGHRRGNA